jgi:hypothetical protein
LESNNPYFVPIWIYLSNLAGCKMITSVNFWLFLVEIALKLLKPTKFSQFFFVAKFWKFATKKNQQFKKKFTCVSFVILDFFNKFYLLRQVEVFFSVLWGRCVGDHLGEGLANLGYMLERELEKFSIPFMYWWQITWVN